MSHSSPFSELSLLSHIAHLAAGHTDPRVVVGPGDDCAVLDGAQLMGGTFAGNASLLLKVDQVIEGKHFARGTPLRLIARKAVARVVSDCAAMGGEPSAFLAACVLPASMSQAEAAELADAVHAVCREFGGMCVGGDISRVFDGPLSVSMTALGVVRGRPLLRSNASAGDGVFVTGTIGGSFTAKPTARDAFPGGGKHLHFVPRVVEAGWLKQAYGEGLHAMLDISDGLGIDAGRIALASGVAIEIDAACIPVSVEAQSVQQAIRDGEDYELLFTSSEDVLRLCPQTQTAVTRIGSVLAPSDELPVGGVRLVLDKGSERIEHTGYQHA